MTYRMSFAHDRPVPSGTGHRTVAGFAGLALLAIGYWPLSIPARAQAGPAFYEITDGVLRCRNMIVTDGVIPSAATPVVTDLDAALDGVSNANAVLWGVSNLGGFGFPAPQGVTNPVAYAQAQIAASQAALLAASAAAAGLPASADLSTLIGSDIPDAATYLNNWSSKLAAGSSSYSEELFSLYSADYDLSQEEGPTLTDIASNSSSSVNLMYGFWQGIDFNRQLISECFALVTGITSWPVPQTQKGEWGSDKRTVKTISPPFPLFPLQSPST